MATTPARGNDAQGGAWGSREAAEAWRRGEASRARLLGDATELLLDLAGVRAGCRVLDVAAGTGDQTLTAARRAGPTGSVLATDIAADMLEILADAARQAGLTNVATRAMDAQDLDLAPDSFDAAVSRHGLMFIPDLQRALASIRRALKPGAPFAAMVWSTAERNPTFALPLVIARRHAGLPAPAPGEPGMFALGAPGALAGALCEAGFRDVTVRAVALLHEAPSAADYLQARKDAAGPLREALDRQGEADRERVWAEIERELRRFEGPAGFAVPGEVLVGAGTQ